MTRHRGRRDLTLFLAAVVAAVSAAPSEIQTLSAQSQVPSFRTGVDMVSVTVTVTDASGRYITDLEQNEFEIYEDRIQQELTFFTRSQLPIALALLIDTSASMERRMQTAQEAAIGFAYRLRPQDLASVIDFDSRVNILEDFTNDGARLERAIRRTAAGGSTSLHNAVYISLKELSKVRARTPDEIRRQSIVVLSDGEDTSSLVCFTEVLELAKRSETATYAIGLRTQGDPRRREFQEAEYVLRQLALVKAFKIMPSVVVPPGTYDHQEIQLVVMTNQGSSLSGQLYSWVGGAFGGERVTIRPSVRYRVGDSFNTEFSLSRNAYDLPGGKFVTNLMIARTSYSFTPRVFIQSLLQYNDKADLWSSNLRLGILGQANTGLFLVYNDTHGLGSVTPEAAGRSLTLKYSHFFDVFR